MAGQQKFGRGMRTPGHKQYKTQGRWVTNKILKVTKHLKTLLKKLIRFEKKQLKTEGIKHEIKNVKKTIERLTSG